MNVIVTGASGFIGKNFLLGVPKSWSVKAVYNASSDFPQVIDKYKLSNIKAVR